MNNKIYTRKYYLDKIRGFYNSDLIKVISGIRRCGKSYFMLSIIEDLKSQGIKDKDIIYLNLDKRGYKNIKTPDQLENAIANLILDDDFKYIFIDEVQNVKNYEEVVNGFREDGNCSIFITGSNSYLLSGELATKLTGRYIEIEMFTLSFYEFLDMKKFLGKSISNNVMNEFNEYIRFGGFPKTLEFDSEEDKLTYITNVIGQITQKDIKGHKRIQNKALFEKIKTYIINNFGATTSLTSIEDYFRTQEHINIKRETINKYIEILENAKIIYKCPRFDVKSKKSLKGEQKYYLADLGIYFANNVDTRINYGPVLENILYTYLKMKNYQVSVGKIGNLECDFIARKTTNYYYVQVAMTIMDDRTQEREYKPFAHIRDNYPKYLFTLDQLLQSQNGINHVNMVEFIKDNKEL
jgi:hypothetical protein